MYQYDANKCRKTSRKTAMNCERKIFVLFWLIINFTYFKITRHYGVDIFWAGNCHWAEICGFTLPYFANYVVGAWKIFSKTTTSFIKKISITEKQPHYIKNTCIRLCHWKQIYIKKYNILDPIYSQNDYLMCHHKGGSSQPVLNEPNQVHTRTVKSGKIDHASEVRLGVLVDIFLHFWDLTWIWLRLPQGVYSIRYFILLFH